MKEKELGERHFGFDSLKFRLNGDMEEKIIIARDCPPCPLLAVEGLQWDRCPLQSAVEGPAAAPPPPRWAAGIPGNNSFLLHVAVQSVLQIDVEEPETSVV